MASNSKLNRTMYEGKKIFYDKWFQVELFLKYLRTLSSGNQYREINLVVRDYEKDWEIVELNNTNKSLNHFVLVCKKYNVKVSDKITKINSHKRKVKFGNMAQMFEQVTEMCSGFKKISNFANATLQDVDPREVQESVVEIKNDIQEAAVKISGMADTFQESFAFFTAFVKDKISSFALQLPELGEWFMSFILILAKIFALAYLLLQPQNQNIKNVTALVTLALPTSVVGNQQLIAGLIRAIQGVSVHNKAQCLEDDASFIQSFFTVGKQLFKGMFTSVDKNAVDALTLSNKKIKVISDYIKSSSTIFDVIMRLFEKIMIIIGDKTLKIYNYLPSWLKEEKFTQLVDEYISLKQNNADLLSKKSHVAAVRVRRLYDKLLKYEADLNKRLSINKIKYTKITPYLRMMVTTVEKIINEIPDHLMEDRDINRKKPYWLYIHGEPRIGKSAMFQPYMINVLARALGYATEYENYVNYTYFLNCADEYREGYWGQWCTNVNDWLQNYKDEQMVQKCIADMTNMIDDNLYALNMAFASKGKVYFNSPLVVSNAQKDIVGQSFLADKCWSSGAHLYARRNIVVEVKLNPKYRHPSGAGINNAYRKERLNEDIPKVGKLFPNEMYNLHFTDPLTGRTICSLEFKEGVQYIVDDAKRYFQSQDEFKTDLFEHFRNEVWEEYNPVAQTLEDDFQDADNDRISCLGCRDWFLASDMHNHSLVCPAYRPESSPILQYIMDMLKYLPEERDSPVLMKIMQSYKDNQYLLTELQLKCKSINCYYDATEVITILTKYAFNGSIIPKTDPAKICIQFKNYICDSIKALCKLTVVYKTPLITSLLFFLTLIGLIVSLSYLFNSTKVSEAQTAEGDKKIKQIRRERMIVAQEYNEQNLVVETKIANQSCKVAIIIKKDNVELENIVYGTMVGVGGDVFVCPGHYYNRWVLMQAECKKNQCEMFIKIMWSSSAHKQQNFLFDDVLVCKLPYKHAVDTVYLSFPKLIQLSNLEKFFCSVSTQSNLNETYLYGMRGFDFQMHTVNADKTHLVSEIVYSHASRYDNALKCEFPSVDIELPTSFKYSNAKVVAGDCGMMLIHCDSTTNCKKILGMHIAGNVKYSIGYACPIFSEDIAEAIKYFSDKRQAISLEAHCLDEITNLPSELYKDTELILEGIKYTINGKKFKTTLPRKNKVQPSVCFDIMESDYGPSLVKPSALVSRIVDGVKISPFSNGIKKMARASNAVPSHEINVILDHMFHSMNEWESNYKDFRVLNDYETLNGSGLLKKLDLTTSAGFPYILNVTSKGKSDLFTVEDGVIKYKDLVKQECNDRINKASHGIIKETYFMDTLKDETRPIEKVNGCVTRVFQVSPVDLNLCLRQYFGAFISFCHSVPLSGEMAVGINANSYEWTLMIKELLVNSTLFINGDGKNFDASLGQQYMMHIVEVINRLYNDGEQNNIIRRVLFATFLNSHHIQGNTVYRAYQGNKSGVALTTIFNNLAGMFAIRLAYYRHQGTMDGYNTRIKAKFYGDDDLISVKQFTNKAGVAFDSLYYRSVWADLGVEYTSAHKMCELQPYSSLDQITFLQRAFVYDSALQIYYPQLKYDTILEIPRWSESDPHNMIDQMARFNSALVEISNYGEEKYNMLYNSFVEYIGILRTNNYVISVFDLFSYKKCKQIIFPHIYL